MNGIFSVGGKRSILCVGGTVAAAAAATTADAAAGVVPFSLLLL